MSQQDTPMGEPPIGTGRRPLAHYIGLAVVIVVIVVSVAAVI